MKTAMRNMGLALAVAVVAPLMIRAASAGPKGSGDLVDKVRHELLMLPYYGIFDDLNYRVDGNVVTLSGAVTRPTLKTDAQRVVGRLEGVGQVVNHIEVLPLSPFDDGIRRAEYRSIFGYASLYRYALGSQPSIHIIVDNGQVTLEGVVGNQGDKTIAGIRANSVSGVFSVTNNLLVAN